MNSSTNNGNKRQTRRT